MEDKAFQPPILKSAADYEAAIEGCLAQMRQLRQRMDRDQAEIDRLKAETRALLDELRAA